MAADQLESRIEDHVVNNPANSGQIEAVMHLRENEEESDSDDYELDSGDILVDSQNNKERDTSLCKSLDTVIGSNQEIRFDKISYPNLSTSCQNQKTLPHH